VPHCELTTSMCGMRRIGCQESCETGRKGGAYKVKVMRCASGFPSLSCASRAFSATVVEMICASDASALPSRTLSE
jgi:hypothetical protein